MGDIKIFNAAGGEDPPTTVTPTPGTSVGKVQDLFVSNERLEEVLEKIENLEAQADANTQEIQDVTQGAPETLDTFKDVSDNMDVDDFIAGLNSD